MLSLTINPEPKNAKEKLQINGGQVGRPLKTCDQCRKSRRKCDNLNPRCTLCQMRGRACTYNEIAKKMKDGLNVYAKPRSKESQVTLRTSTSRLRYWLHNLSSAVTSAYNPALVMMATRSKFLPNLLMYLQGSDRPSIPNHAIALREEETNALTLELVDIYFSNINPYCPIVSQEQFKDAFEKPIWIVPFQLLVSTILFVSVGYHPEFDVVSRAWPIIASRTRQLLKKCYMTPHPATMQALLLLGMQNNSSDKDGLAPYSSFYLGMAHRMGIQLGYHRLPALPPHSNEQRLRTWWAIPIIEQLLMHCTGRRPTIALCDRYVRLTNQVLPTHQTDLDTKIGDYHRFTFFYARLISRVSILRQKYPRSVPSSIRLVSADPSPNNPESSPALAAECWRLEAAFHQWFRAYSAPASATHHLLQPPPPGDYFLALIQLNYFLALHEIAATLRRPSDPVGPGLTGLLPSSPVLTLAAFTKCSPTEKCIAMAFLGATALMSSVGMDTFLFHGTNYKWWCSGQFMFTMLEMTQRHPDHPLVPSARAYIAFFMTALAQGQSRWACIADFSSKARTILELFPNSSTN